jgi:hypothetical protein
VSSRRVLGEDTGAALLGPERTKSDRQLIVSGGGGWWACWATETGCGLG